METPEPVNLQNLSISDDDGPPYDGDQCTVTLEKGLDLRALRDPEGEGADFTVKEPEEPDPDQEAYFDKEEIFKQLNRECLGDDDDEDGDENMTPFAKMARKMEDITPDKDEGVLKSTIRHGTGPVVVGGVTVTVHYNCYLEYSDEPYDSTRLRSAPEKFKLCDGTIIQGMELALSTMRVGELSRFLIKPEYGFGKQGIPPRVPANATILMEIELMSFTDRAELDEYNAMPEEERKEIAFKKKLHVVNVERKEGNDLFHDGKHSKALTKYMKGLRILEGAHMQNEEEEEQMKHVLVKLCLNIALCALKLKQPARVLDKCNRVLAIERKNVKALYRKGQAYMQLGEFNKAQEFMTRAQQQMPSDASIARGLQELERHWKRFKKLERTMCAKMFPDWQKDTSQKDVDKSRGIVTEEFKNMIKEKLKLFLEMPSLVEMPYQARSLTSAELKYMEEVAKEMGMTVQKREFDKEQVIKFVKPAEEG